MSSLSKTEWIARIEELKSSKAEDGLRIPRGWGTSDKNLKELQGLEKKIREWKPTLSDLSLEGGQRWAAASIGTSRGSQNGFVLVDAQGHTVPKKAACVVIYRQDRSAQLYFTSMSSVTITTGASTQTTPTQRKRRATPPAEESPVKKRKRHNDPVKVEKKEREEKDRDVKHELRHTSSQPRNASPTNHPWLSTFPVNRQNPVTMTTHPTESSFWSGRRILAPPKKLALVIGCSRYPHRPLPAAKTDAEEMWAKLRDLGYDVTPCLDPENLLRCFTAFFNLLNNDDSALIYYAGHATQSRGVNCLQQLDGKKQVKLADLYESVKQKRLYRIGFIIDACRGDQDGLRQSSYGDWQLPDVQNSFFTFACGPSTVAVEETTAGSDGKKHGRFTRALLAQMNNTDDINAIMRRVCRSVSETSDGRQRPWHHECIMIERSCF